MTVTLELKPDIEQRLAALASVQGVPVETYLLSLIESLALPAVGERATLEEFEAAMDSLSQGTEAIPVLSPEALSRESIYGDRA